MRRKKVNNEEETKNLHQIQLQVFSMHQCQTTSKTKNSSLDWNIKALNRNLDFFPESEKYPNHPH
jgi:hypothetical protein